MMRETLLLLLGLVTRLLLPGAHSVPRKPTWCMGGLSAAPLTHGGALEAIRVPCMCLFPQGVLLPTNLCPAQTFPCP